MVEKKEQKNAGSEMSARSKLEKKLAESKNRVMKVEFSSHLSKLSTEEGRSNSSANKK